MGIAHSDRENCDSHHYSRKPGWPFRFTATRDEYYRILDQDPVPKLTDRRVPKGWVNHYCQDDWSVVAFFYLDRPENGLPPISGLKLRTRGIE